MNSLWWHHSLTAFQILQALHALLHIVKDVVKHHFIHLSHHPSVHPSGHPSVPSWFVYSDTAEKEWNTNTMQWKIIYISVLNFYFIFIFILGFLDLGTLILSLSQQLKELGWAFFFKKII
jgi:hypothetical protein